MIDIERTLWRLFQKRVMCTIFAIYVFIIIEIYRGINNSIIIQTQVYLTQA